jgi:CBS domain-containing protein
MEHQQPGESGIEIPNQRMLEFLRSVPPFDILGTGELTHLISQMEMAYFPAGRRIKSKGDRAFQHLYIIQKGSAEVSLIDDEGEDLLVDVRGEGDYFGATSLLQDKPAMFDISAGQDLICLMLPAQNVRQLVKSYPVFERYFSFSLARTMPSALRFSSPVKGLPT